METPPQSMETEQEDFLELRESIENSIRTNDWEAVLNLLELEENTEKLSTEILGLILIHAANNGQLLVIRELFKNRKIKLQIRVTDLHEALKTAIETFHTGIEVLRDEYGRISSMADPYSSERKPGTPSDISLGNGILEEFLNDPEIKRRLLEENISSILFHGFANDYFLPLICFLQDSEIVNRIFN